VRQSARRMSSLSYQGLAPRELDKLIGEAFRQQGFTVTGFGGSHADLALTRRGERFLVVYKDWRKQEVGVAAIRELALKLRTANAHGGYVITVGRFSREAQALAREAGIELLDGAAVAQFLNAVDLRKSA
jgi:restriction system protein